MRHLHIAVYKIFKIVQPLSLSIGMFICEYVNLALRDILYKSNRGRTPKLSVLSLHNCPEFS